ncbi:hypothetical protein [Candidatus Nitrospira neomarina]|uniref:Uncharacterized protein n=1 Tax=Candidatus Nitrospira neomarina TaxID=3020899 RepID=A0AA96GRE9_9BACT|nr:hypothetical protein [Candidatus Nitrospira neomarina]WNM63918.1 hypothetical protein PQG83_09215 [Candidatus Nitrospira neomarina]
MTERIQINAGWKSLNGHIPRTLDLPWGRHALFLTWLLLTGCAEPPISQLNAATQALEDARISEAEHYAIERFAEAETAFRQVQQTLDRQEDRMPLFRNYDPVITMLSEVFNSATQAKIEAIANKKESKANAEVALAFAKQHLQDVRALLADVSAHTPDHGELDQLLQAFQDTETLLAEIESIMAQEHFIDVMTTSHSVESFATRIQAQIISVKRLAAKQHV